MRVCLICNQIAAWGKIGGFGTNTRRIGRALVSAGVEVHVVVPRRQGQKHVATLDGMIVHGQSTLEVLFGKRVYTEIGADVYHSQEPTICTYNARQAEVNRSHLVTSMDPRDSADWRLEFRNATWSRRFKYPVQRFYEDSRLVHEAVRHADATYVEADFLRPKTRQLYGLAYQPELLPKPVAIPSEPFVKSSRPTCVFLGRFDPRKRPEIFFRLARTMPDVDFIAIGRAHDRSYHNYLRDRYFATRNLTITDFVDPFRGPRMSEILSRAWILVHPAAREGLPTAFQEASVHEMAVVAHVNPGGYVERFGRVIPERGGIATLRDKLSDFIQSGAWREKGKAGRDWNIANHSTSVSLARHLEEYHEHVDRHRTGKAA